MLNISPGIYGIVLGQKDFRSLKCAFMVSLLSQIQKTTILFVSTFLVRCLGLGLGLGLEFTGHVPFVYL